MNYRIITYVIGWVLNLEAICMTLPAVTGLIYGEKTWTSFLITGLISALAGTLLVVRRPEKPHFFMKEGCVSVALSWIALSLIGSLPFMISGTIPHFVDALFETVSGFTTTGASIMASVEDAPRCILMWRSFTHWIGGMGFLIFILALIPSLSTNTIFLLKAESPGPNPGKIVPKIKETAKILYMIYFIMTVIETILLMMAGLSLYDALIHALGTAGTGGFSNMNSSVASFNNPAVEWIITIFMLLFGVNFVLYFQMFKGDFKSVFKSEELKYYILMVVVSIVLITINIIDFNGGNIGLSIRESSFQVASVITTTGYATTDFNLWPTFSKIILTLLMFAGAMAGSTGGGIKTVRIVLILKAIKREIDKILHPKRIQRVKMDGKVVEEEVVSGVLLFIGSYIVISLIAIFIVALDGFDLVTTTTSVIATISNIGPGFEMVGATGNFAAFSPLSKIVLSFCMLAGRLEIYPMLILFSPSIWRKKY